ncbi:glycoside hydrolase family 16 protein [Marinimicrobium locisalis]|uniref:glycoside hydrolase family 16 protein n=1 Tax=Marinimicrobium locisalis TaxID=546022 RepID=UPI00322208A4
MKPLNHPTIGLGLALVLLTGCGSDSDDATGSSSSRESSESSSAASTDSDDSSSSRSESSVSSGQSSSNDNSASSSSEGAEYGWTMVWNDEFEGESIDADKWSYERNCAGGGNNELQCYTDRADNSYVEDGMLHIVAKQETFSGPGVFDDDPAYDPDDTSVTRNYTSARLRSKNKGDWTYGRIEVRAKMPQGQGLWPAIWMLPTDFSYGGWAASGEIDIFEAVNSNTEGAGNDIHGTLHYGGAWPNNVYSGTSYSPEALIWENFHTYALEWEEGEMRWYVNDVHFATQTSDGWYNVYWDGEEAGFKVGEGAAPFNERFHLLLNVAVGGEWPGAPNEQTSFPQEMIVDYVRVYQCGNDPQTGQGCATSVDESVEPLTGNAGPEPVSTSLYRNGAATLTFELGEATVENTLQPGLYSPTAGNVVSTPMENGAWSVQFNASPGNVFLSTASMAGEPAAEDGFQFQNMQTYGELRFDLLVEAIEPETELLVKVDSGWPNVSFTSIDIPETGEWATITVPMAALENNDVEPGQVDFGSVINPFVIEAKGGTAEVQLNNIEVRCMSPCGIEPVPAGVSTVLDSSFDVYVDGEPGVNWDFGVGTWDNGTGHVSVSDVEDPDRGTVLQVDFSESSNNGLAFVQSTGAKDASAFAADGHLEFDIKVLSYGSNTSGLVVKAESGPGEGTGDLLIQPEPPVGEWTTVSIPIADMLNHSGTNPAFDLSAFNTPFVFFPAWEDQGGVEVQLDNIRWTR